MLGRTMRSHKFVLKLPKLRIVLIMQGMHQPRCGNMMEDGISVRDEWKFHTIAGTEGCYLLLILSHLLADLFEILPVRRT